MEQQEALEQIKLIREMMTKASHKFWFSPWQWIEWGIVVIIGSFITLWLQARGDTSHIPMVWLAVLVVGGTLEGIAWILDTQSKGLDPFNPFFMKIWGVLGCIMIPATIFTFTFLQINTTEYISGLWLITIGSALMALVLLGERKELILFGTQMLVCGILSISILIKYSLHLAMVSFGLCGLLMGLYLLFQEKKINKSEV